MPGTRGKNSGAIGIHLTRFVSGVPARFLSPLFAPHLTVSDVAGSRRTGHVLTVGFRGARGRGISTGGILLRAGSEWNGLTYMPDLARDQGVLWSGALNPASSQLCRGIQVSISTQ